MQFIDSQGEFEKLLGAIPGEPLLAVDTEAAGYHRYRDRICLVQLSTRTETWVLDALAIDVSALGETLLDERTEVVFHDADYDLRLLGRDHGIRIGRLFDTKIAAQFLGESAIGLAGLAERHLGVRLDKTHQRADWARRPLSPEQLEYAAEDTRHLPRLRDRLAAGLDEAGRLGWAVEEFRLRTAAPPVAAEPEVEGFWRLRNIRDLRGRQLAVLRALHDWRDAAAETRDVAPFRVLGNDVIVGLARNCPTTRSAMAGVPGMGASLLDRYGKDLLEIVGRAVRSAPETWPVRQRGPRRPPPDPAFERRVERLKAVRDAVADSLGLDRGFLMPRQQLEDIARLEPADTEALRAVPDVRNWQIEALGTLLVDALG